MYITIYYTDILIYWYIENISPCYDVNAKLFLLSYMKFELEAISECKRFTMDYVVCIGTSSSTDHTFDHTFVHSHLYQVSFKS